MKNTAIFLLLLCASFTAQAQELYRGERLLDPVILAEQAWTSDPGLEAMRQRINSLKHQIPQAASLPDPVVGFSLLNFPVDYFPFDFTDQAMTQTQVSLSQSFPASGVRQWRKRIVEESVEVVSLNVEKEKLRLQIFLAGKILKLSYVEAERAVISEKISLVESLLETTGNLYESGKVELQSLLDLKLEKANLQSRLFSLATIFDQTSADINYILGTDYLFDSTTIPPLKLSKLHQERVYFESLALKNNPELAILIQQANVETARENLALKELYPGFTLKFAYSYRYDYPDLWTAGVTIPIPFRSEEKQEEKVAESRTMVRSLRLQADKYKRTVKNDIAQAFMVMEEIYRQINLYEEELIPLTKMNLETNKSRFEAGQQGLNNVIVGQKKLLDLEISLINLRLRHEMAVVDLARAAGGIQLLRGEKDE